MKTAENNHKQTKFHQLLRLKKQLLVYFDLLSVYYEIFSVAILYKKFQKKYCTFVQEKQENSTDF